MAFFLIDIAILSSLFDLSSSHSWIECADYRTDTVLTSNDYNRDDCNGFTRGWNTFTFDNFGEDHGQDFEIKLFNEDRMCDKTIGSPEDGYSDSYDSDNPMPSYTVGQTVKLLWPAKNHANNEDCDYNYEPDHALKLFINSEPDPTEDPSKNQSDWTLVHDWHEGYTFDEINTYGYNGLKSRNGIKGVGFQHCPWYCDNTDLAICFGNFTVPNIFPRDGYYTFLWYWRKNAVRTYTSCWEAYVSGTDGATPAPTDNPTDKPTDKPTNSDTGSDTGSDTSTDTDTGSNTNSESQTDTVTNSNSDTDSYTESDTGNGNGNGNDNGNDNDTQFSEDASVTSGDSKILGMDSNIFYVIAAAIGGSLILFAVFVCVFFACRKRSDKTTNNGAIDTKMAEFGLANVIARGGNTSQAITVATEVEEVEYAQDVPKITYNSYNSNSHSGNNGGIRPPPVPPRPQRY